METPQTDMEKQETVDSNASKSKTFHDYTTPLNIIMSGVPPLHPTFKCYSPDQSQALLREAVGLITAGCSQCHPLLVPAADQDIFPGHKLLLVFLHQASSFSGLSSLASLLVRHVLEVDLALKNTMKKIIHSSAATSTAAEKLSSSSRQGHSEGWHQFTEQARKARGRWLKRSTVQWISWRL